MADREDFVAPIPLMLLVEKQPLVMHKQMDMASVKCSNILQNTESYIC